MTLAEARKNGIPELGIEGCDGCRKDWSNCVSGSFEPQFHDGTRIHGVPNAYGRWILCTAPSDDALFAALWGDRERLRELLTGCVTGGDVMKRMDARDAAIKHLSIGKRWPQLDSARRQA